MVIEKTLVARLSKEQDISLKRSLYNALVNTAFTESAGARLFSIWRNKGKSIDLTLSENELTNLSYQVAIRQVKGADNILQEQLAAIKNEDRKKRMAFVIPAASPLVETRNQFFKSLEDPANRASEPWVLTGLSLLHHPLRQKTSQKYVAKSLEMVEEIQLTGDIFFPARWLNSTLGRYKSAEVASEVNLFIEQHPDLSPKLKDKMLQAADMVFRASALAEQTVNQ